MKNLINFLIRSWVFILFLFLQIAALVLLFSNNNYHSAQYFNSANTVSGKVYETQSEITDYFTLKSANADLAEENARLRAMLPTAYEITDKKFFVKNDTIFAQKYSYANAKVINNSTNRRNNYITLNKGSLQGIQPKMGVISPNGIVGVVKDVSPNYATVLSFLHKAVKVSAKIRKSGYFGSLIWEGGNPDFGYLKDIPSYVKLVKGDTIVTTSYSDIFPEDIMVGVVESLDEKPNDSFHNIKVKLSTNFTTLSYVYVIKDVTRTERDSLQQKTIKDVEKGDNNGD
jgi:rod shape-determining protein MreC